MFSSHKSLTWFLIGFLFTFILSIVLLHEYVHLELTGDILLAYAGISILVGLIFTGSHRGKTHFGHLPFLIGLILSFWAGLALFGNFELPTLKKTLWWVIEDVTVKRNLAIVWFTGVFLFVVGVRMIGQNIFFLRPFGRSRR